MSEEKIDIEAFERIKDESSRFSRLGNQYVVGRTKSDIGRVLTGITGGLRLHGMMILRLRSGHIELIINTEKYRLSPGNIVVLTPGVVIGEGVIGSRGAEWDFVFASVEFLKDINMDLSSVNFSSLSAGKSPVMELTRDETERFMPYVRLMADNAEDESSVFSIKIARSLFTAMIYQMMEFYIHRIGEDETHRNNLKRYRRPTTYVRDFMRLLHLNYMKERSSEFYASRLCLSSKYLSIIVKEATGHSVSDWISEFVITEAKNLLRFSGKSIQQVAYALNFPSQSSFGKYFKRFTGMSPTDYQKT